MGGSIVEAKNLPHKQYVDFLQQLCCNEEISMEQFLLSAKSIFMCYMWLHVFTGTLIFFHCLVLIMIIRSDYILQCSLENSPILSTNN